MATNIGTSSLKIVGDAIGALKSIDQVVSRVDAIQKEVAGTQLVSRGAINNVDTARLSLNKLQGSVTPVRQLGQDMARMVPPTLKGQLAEVNDQVDRLARARPAPRLPVPTSPTGGGGMMAGLSGIGSQLSSGLSMLPGGHLLSMLGSAGPWAAAAAAVAGLTAALKSAADHLDAVAKLADRLGTTTANMQTFQHLAGLSGTAIGDANNMIQIFNRQLGMAQTGSGRAADRLTQLGLSASNLANMDITDALQQVSTAISSVGTASERAAIEAELFGRSGMTGDNFVRSMSQLQATRELLDRLGVTISEVDAANIQEMNDAMANSWTGVQGIVNTVLTTIAPVVRDLSNAITELFAVINPGIGALGDILQLLLRPISMFLSFVVRIARAFDPIRQAAQEVFAEIMQALGSGIGGDQFEAIAVMLEDFIKPAVAEVVAIIKEWGPEIVKLTGLLMAVGKVILGVILWAVKLALRAWLQNLSAIRTGWDTVVAAMQPVTNFLGRMIEMTFALAKTIGDVLLGAFVSMARAMANMATTLADARDQMGVAGALIPDMRPLANGLNNAADSAANYRRELQSINSVQDLLNRFSLGGGSRERRVRPEIQAALQGAERLNQELRQAIDSLDNAGGSNLARLEAEYARLRDLATRNSAGPVDLEALDNLQAALQQARNMQRELDIATTASGIRDLNTELQQSVETFGMSSEAARVWRLQQELLRLEALAGRGVMSAAMQEQIRTARQQLTAAQQLQAEINRLQEGARLDQVGRDLTTQMRTPMEVLAARMDELNTLVATGRISWETYRRAAAQAVGEVERLSQASIPNPQGLLAGSQEAAQAVIAFQNQSANNPQSGVQGILQQMQSADRNDAELQRRLTADLLRELQRIRNNQPGVI